MGDRRLGLPRGLANLSQYDRLIWAMVRVVAEKGYDGVTVGAIVQRAGVSRSTFYEHFANREECLFAAYDQVVDVLFDFVAEAYAGKERWPVRARRALDAFLRGLASEPEVAKMAMVEVPSAGPEAQRHYRKAFERFGPFFADGRGYVGEQGELPDGVETMALGGAEAIIFDEVVAGRTANLPAMLPEIFFALLVPYLGPEGAAAEVGQTAPA